MLLDLAFLAVAAVVVGAIAVTHVIMTRALRHRPEPASPPARYPSLTVIRPIRGLDIDEEENLRAALDTGYPGEVETIFVLDDDLDPAYTVVARAVRAHRRTGHHGSARVLVAGAPPPGRTGKLNAMIAGAAEARGELIAFGDSDTRPDRDVLRELVDALVAAPSAGCAFAPVVVDHPAQTAGDVGYALMLNAWYGPAVARVAARDGELPFIMGQLMVFKREALDVVGGVACAEGQLVDDMYIGACLASAGWRNVMIRHPLAISNGGMTLGEFWALMRRWLLFSHNGLPSAFTGPNWLRGLEVWLGVMLLVWGAALDRPLGVLAGAVVLGASMASQARLQEAFGGAHIALKHLWVTLLIPLLGPLVVLSTLLDRRVSWRGRSYALDLDARLDGKGAPRGRAATQP
jgi:ceramide glucosyltransferase